MTSLFNVEDASIFLCLTPKGVRRLVRQGILPCVRIGKFIRFREEDIKAFVNSHLQKAKQ